MRSTAGSLLAIVLVAELVGCDAPRRRSVATDPVADPAVEVAPAARTAEPGPPTKSTPPTAVEPAPVTLTVVISDDSPAYRDVAHALRDRFGPELTTVVDARDPVDLTVKRTTGDQVIMAVGLGAALALRDAGTQPAYFCQVFNHRPHSLLDAGMAGIDMIPDAQVILRRWKETFPEARKIGIVTGPGHEDRLATIARKAERLGLNIDHRTVNSDKEAQLAFHHLLRNVHGLWMLPDNRVLSREVIEDILLRSQAMRRPVLVNTPALLALGAALSATAEPADVAEAAFRRMTAPTDTRRPAPMVAVDRARFQVNADVVARMRAATSPDSSPSR